MSLLIQRHKDQLAVEKELLNLSDQIDVLKTQGGRVRIVTQVPGGGGTDVKETVEQIFVTAVTGAGAITNKVFETNTVPANKVLTAFESDNDDITLTIQILVIGEKWQNSFVRASGGGASLVTVNKQDWTELVTDARIFTATINLTNAKNTGTIVIESSNKAFAVVFYTRALDPPQVTKITVKDQGTNPDPYPGVQTELKDGDTFKIVVKTEAHADEVFIKDFEATAGRGLQGPFTVTGGTTGEITITAGNANATKQNIKAYAKITGETNGPDFISTGTNEVDCNQTVPAFTGGAQSDITYPATQEALKDAETCSVTITHTNAAAGDTYLYDDNSTTELTIPSPTVYAATKAGVARASGNYRETGTNYRLTATRTTKNGASTTKNATVKIAHTLPTLTVTPTTRKRTDDGTNGYKDHTITLTSSQANLSTHTPTLETAAGDASDWKPASSWVASGALAYTRDQRVEDADIKTGGQAANDFTWITISVKNRAGKEATTITTNPNYSIGGFEKRRLTIPAWPNREADISVFAVDTAKLTAELLSKGGGGPAGGTIQTFDNSPGQGSTPDDEVDKFCISDGADKVDDDSKFYYNKDQAAAEANSGGTAKVDIEETA